jgi:hypothetical protein
LFTLIYKGYLNGYQILPEYSSASTEEKEAVGRLEELTVRISNNNKLRKSGYTFVDVSILTIEGKNLKSLTLINE